VLPVLISGGTYALRRILINTRDASCTLLPDAVGNLITRSR